MVKNLPAMQKMWVWCLNWEDPLEEVLATSFKYSCLENPMDREAWRVPVLRFTKSQTQWSTLHEYLLRKLFFFFLIRGKNCLHHLFSSSGQWWKCVADFILIYFKKFIVVPRIALISHASKVMLKILQTRLQQYVNHELPDVKAGFRKFRRTKDQIANICWIIKKVREFQKNIYFFFID